MKRLSSLTMAAVLSLWLPACGDSACPSPVFGAPSTATWPTAAPGLAQGLVVVRWAATGGDPLPERYYATVRLRGPVDGGATPVQRVTLTAPRELTLETRDLEEHQRVSPRVAVTLEFDDSMGFVPCSHPGMSDAYLVDLTLTFDVPARTPPPASGRCGSTTATAASPRREPLAAADRRPPSRPWRRRSSAPPRVVEPAPHPQGSPTATDDEQALVLSLSRSVFMFGGPFDWLVDGVVTLLGATAIAVIALRSLVEACRWPPRARRCERGPRWCAGASTGTRRWSRRSSSRAARGSFSIAGTPSGART